MFHLQDQKELQLPSIHMTGLEDDQGWMLVWAHRVQAAHSPVSVKFEAGLAHLDIRQQHLLLQATQTVSGAALATLWPLPLLLWPLPLLLHLELRAAHSWGRPSFTQQGLAHLSGSQQLLLRVHLLLQAAHCRGLVHLVHTLGRGEGGLQLLHLLLKLQGRGDRPRRHYMALCAGGHGMAHDVIMNTLLCAHEAACNRLCREDGGGKGG